MKEQIQQLIAEGRTEDALDLLVRTNGDAILLQSRYNSGKRNYNMGLIDFSEWQRILSQVNYAALEMSNASRGTTDSRSTPANTTSSVTPSTRASSNHTVFISYNHGDKESAARVKDFLEKAGINVTIDQEKMQAGQSIVQFIQDSIKRNDFILSLISEKSLQSGWVGKESVAASFAGWLTEKQFIPVSLDHSFTDTSFFIQAVRTINEKMEQKNKEIEEIRSLGADPSPIQDEVKRLYDLRNNLGQILQTLRSVLTVDISETNFEPGMKKVLERIQQN